MPELGDITRGNNIGRKSDRTKYIWSACIDCGKERWVRIDRQSHRCPHCAGLVTPNLQLAGRRGKESLRWKGGRHKNFFGYIEVYCDPEDYFAPMRNGSEILEHRLVVARFLGRLLTRDEIVHHLNGIKDDNREENLVLVSIHEHSPRLVVKPYEERIRELEEKVRKLEREEGI